MTISTPTTRRPISSQVLSHILQDIKGSLVSDANEIDAVLDEYILPAAGVRNVVGAAKELDKAILSLVAAIAVINE